MPGVRTGWDEPVEVAEDVYAPLRERKFGKDKVLLLLDARHACYRSIHTRSLSTSRGVPTSALHGLLEIAQAACEAANTGRLLVVWDGALKYKRAIFAAYKERQDRDRTPAEQAEYREQQLAIRVAREGLTMLGVPQVLVPELEADDVIGIAASKINTVSHPSVPPYAVVLSDDKDYYQLVTHRVMVWRGVRGELVDLANFKSRHGFSPDLYADYKALVGEPKTGDNIPGVQGIGDITAGKLVGTLGGLENVIKACEGLVLKGKAKKAEANVYQQRGNARLSLRLAKIMTRSAHAQPHGINPAAVDKAIAQAIRYACGERVLPLRQALRFCQQYEFTHSMEPRRFAARCGFRLTA